MDWQPILSAPRSGERVLLLRRQRDKGPTLVNNPVIGSYSERYWTLEVTSNHHYAGDADLVGWHPLPHKEPEK